MTQEDKAQRVSGVLDPLVESLALFNGNADLTAKIAEVSRRLPSLHAPCIRALSPFAGTPLRSHETRGRDTRETKAARTACSI